MVRLVFLLIALGLTPPPQQHDTHQPSADKPAALMSGLGRIAFVHKKFADAERSYNDVLTRFARSHYAPAAMYWRAVARYSASHDHTILGKVAEELRTTYSSSVWATKAIPWLPSTSPPS